jgi:hypothetical protein
MVPAGLALSATGGHGDIVGFSPNKERQVGHTSVRIFKRGFASV